MTSSQLHKLPRCDGSSEEISLRTAAKINELICNDDVHDAGLSLDCDFYLSLSPSKGQVKWPWKRE